MPLAIGGILALAVSLGAAAMRLDRDRAFYPTVLVVIASYYVLFAVMGDAPRAIVADALIAGVFVLAAAIGFRRSLWLVAAGLVAHGALDLLHGSVVPNPGVPLWWPPFCMAYDVSAAAFLAWTLRQPASSPRPRAITPPSETSS